MRHRGEFRERLREWFARDGRDYPWRKTRDPYAILVAEVMLQQTRIATVLERGFYTRFLQAFPDVGELAAAGDEELLKAWEGLGYYRRARMLRATAQAILNDHGGEFPSDLDSLLRLPGVGPYTAGALRAFAFELPAVLVDGNVIRVMARLVDERGELSSAKGTAKIWKLAAELADDLHPRVHHSAVMELGQTYCAVRNPDCGRCPVADFCATRLPQKIPRKKPVGKAEEITELAVWWRDRRGRVLMHQESGRRRTGLWKLPLRDAGAVADLPVLSISRYAITRYRVTLIVRDGGVVKPGAVEHMGDAWIAPAEVDTLAMAAPFRREVEKLLRAQ